MKIPTTSETGVMALAAATVAMATLTLLAGCPPPPPVPPPPPEPGPASTTCAEVCAVWGDLKCLHAEPTPAGVECLEVCETNDHWDLACMGAVESCAQIDSCPRD